MKNFDLSNDVVDFSINQGSPDFMQDKQTVLANILIDHLNEALASHSNGLSDLFGDGIDCRVMKTNNPKWQKGKLKLVLDFLPDEE
jgi:hypothetical protein